jgi:hypothetical protein
MRPEDLDALVAYWHESSIDYLESLGVDPTKLGSPAATRARLSAGMDDDSKALTVVAEMESELVAYSNMVVRGRDTACCHLHTLRDDAMVRNVVYQFFPQVSEAVVGHLGVSRLRFEASVGNLGINRYLQSFGLESRRVYLEKPDGLAQPGDFNVYELEMPEDRDRLLASGEGWDAR